MVIENGANGYTSCWYQWCTKLPMVIAIGVNFISMVPLSRDMKIRIALKAMVDQFIYI
jgi:hypothetical protein